jgi:hypothetical protein
MSTLLDIVTGSLTAIGQLGQGQTANAEDGALGQRCMNLQLAKWSADRLMIPYVATRTYTLVANTADYSVGPNAATCGPTRPTFIESAQVVVPGTSYTPSLSVLDKSQWDAVANRGAIADVPDKIYVEYSFPNLTFHINPKPVAGMTIFLGCWEQLQQFATLFDTFAFPPEYEELMESNLAIILAPYYDQPVPQTLLQRAADAMVAVQKKNAQGIGGSLSAAQKLMSPNVGQPIPSGAAQ